VVGSVNKNGARTFTLPGLLKITVASIPAKPKRKGINPFTKQEQWFAAKPATVRVKVRPLKKLKDAAAGQQSSCVLVPPLPRARRGKVLQKCRRQDCIASPRAART